MLLKVFNPVLAQPMLPATDQPPDEVLSIFRDVGDLDRKLESLLVV